MVSTNPWPRHPRWMAQISAHVRDLAGTPRGPSAFVAAVMFPLAPAEYVELAAEMGPRWRVVDGRRVETADIVLLLPCSAQTTAAVRTLFPAARLIVVDSTIDDVTPTFGPVRRALDAGADVYTAESGICAA